MYKGLQYRFNVQYSMPIVFENSALGYAICGRGQSISIFQNVVKSFNGFFASDIFALDGVQNKDIHSRMNVIILGY